MRDLGIYNNSEPKKKKDSGITRREFFCILATIFIMVYSALYIYKIETSEVTPCEQPVQQQEIKQTRMAVTLPDSYNPISGKRRLPHELLQALIYGIISSRESRPPIVRCSPFRQVSRHRFVMVMLSY